MKILTNNKNEISVLIRDVYFRITHFHISFYADDRWYIIKRRNWEDKEFIVDSTLNVSEKYLWKLIL